jgi:hypothetical protein
MVYDHAMRPFTCYVRTSLAHPPPKWDDFWLQIQGFWLVLSKKVGAPPHFLLPLDTLNLTSAETDTAFTNSLLLELSPKSGGHRLYFSAPSRIEIIKLYDALKSGSNEFTRSRNEGSVGGDFECDFQATSGFMNLSKRTEKLRFTGSGLTIGDMKQFPLESIVSLSAKQNDPNCQSKLVVSYLEADGSTHQRELSGISPPELKQMYALFVIGVKRGDKT